MSIDLGYAPLELPEGVRASLIDVPGHERFVRTMLAGVGPVRLVLFVVAADEGWKPQSEEHLRILELLGVSPEGVVHLRLEGSCDGCPSSTQTVKLAIERAIEEAAPEITRVEVENLTREREPQLLQIRPMRPEWQEPCPAVETGAGAGV
jgi:Fe-S cluster biogenesis protein NfuA